MMVFYKIIKHIVQEKIMCYFLRELYDVLFRKAHTQVISPFSWPLTLNWQKMFSTLLQPLQLKQWFSTWCSVEHKIYLSIFKGFWKIIAEQILQNYVQLGGVWKNIYTIFTSCFFKPSLLLSTFNNIKGCLSKCTKSPFTGHLVIQQEFFKK